MATRRSCFTFLLILLVLCQAVFSFECSSYTNACQCTTAGLGSVCLWCPADNTCKTRNNVDKSINCAAPYSEIKESLQSCTSGSQPVISEGLVAAWNGEDTSLLTDNTDAGELFTGNSDRVFMDLKGFFKASKITIRLRVPTESVAGDSDALLSLKKFGEASKVATRPPAGFDTSGESVESCLETPTTLQGSVLIDCSLDLPSDHPIDGITIAFDNVLPRDDQGEVIPVTLAEVSAFSTPITVVDGLWARITSWEECTNTCGSGNQTRTRTCSNPVPEYGGAWCNGPSEFHRECKDTTGCPTDWGVVFTIGWWQFTLITLAVVKKTRSFIHQRQGVAGRQYAQKLVEDAFEDSDAMTDEAWFQHQQNSQGFNGRRSKLEETMTL